MDENFRDIYCDIEGNYKHFLIFLNKVGYFIVFCCKFQCEKIMYMEIRHVEIITKQMYKFQLIMIVM
jgi:hypothetical protein